MASGEKIGVEIDAKRIYTTIPCPVCKTGETLFENAVFDCTGDDAQKTIDILMGCQEVSFINCVFHGFKGSAAIGPSRKATVKSCTFASSDSAEPAGLMMDYPDQNLYEVG